VPGALGYQIVRQATPGSVVTFTSTGCSYPALSLTNGTNYAFTVSARTASGMTPPAATVSTVPVVLPAAPNSLRIITAGRTRVLLNWAAAGGATGYTVYRATTAGGPYTQVATDLESTTWLDSGLPAGSSAFYVVQTQNMAARSSYSSELGVQLDATVAAAPTGLMATPGHSSARVTWSPVANATGYLLYVLETTTQPPVYTEWVTSGTRYDAISLSNGNLTRFFVGAVVNGVVGDVAEASATPLMSLAPRRITNAAIASVTATRVSFSYTNPAGSPVVNLLRATQPGGPYTQIATTFTDTTVTPNTTYYYVLRPDIGAAQGELSNEVVVTTSASGVPSVPTGLAVVPIPGGLAVSWNPVPGTSGYVVNTSPNPGGPFAAVGCTVNDGHDTFCTVSGTNATPLSVVVSARNNGADTLAQSAQSAPVTGTPSAMGLATPVVGALPGNGVVSVYWSAITNASQYRVWRRVPFTTDWVELPISPTAAISYNDTSVANGTLYDYAVQAFNPSLGRTSGVGTLFAPTQPSVMRPARATGFTVSQIASGILASWSPVPGANGYSVKASTLLGGSVNSTSPGCSTTDAYETKCHFSATNTQPYVVTLCVLGPGLNGACADEMLITPTASPPDTPTVAATLGNSAVTTSITAVPGAQYRFARRLRGRDWEVFPLSSEPSSTFVHVSSTEAKYGLQVVSGTQVSGWDYGSFLTPVITAAPTPTNVVVTPTNGGFVARWDPVPGINTYTVATAPTASGPWTNRDTSNSAFETLSVVTSLNNGTPYFVGVSASTVGGFGSGVRSPSQPVTPSATLPPVPVLTLTRGFQAVQLEWTAVGAPTGFRVYRRLPNRPWRLLTTLTGISWRDLDVENGELVSYTVEALNAAGSTFSTIESTTIDPTLLPPPAGLTLLAGNGTVTVSWDPVPGALGYRVQRAATLQGAYSQVCSLSGAFETRCNVSVTDGTTPFFRVLTVNSANSFGLWSSPVTGATASTALPLTPGAPMVTAPGPSGTLRITWSAISGATGYRLYRRASAGVPGAALVVSGTSYDDTGLTSGTSYLFYLQAQNGVGLGAWSPPSTALAAP
jgi:pectate lyase